MVGVARQEGELPVLQLHNWANSPLVISLFQSAALAPSRNKICLLSCHHEALLIPLGFSLSSSLVNFSASISSDLPETFTVPGSIASCSTFTPGKDPQQEVLVEEVVSDNLESAVSSRESSRAVHIKSSSGVHIDSEFHRTPEYFIDRRGFANFQEYLVSEKLDIQSSSSQPTPLPSSTSSPSSAFLDPHQISRSPSPKHGATPDPQVSSSFPVLSDVECFSWACCGDEYEANQSSGPFSEILLTGGKEGLIIHAFCRKVGNQDRYENSESHDMGDCAQLHPLSEQYSSGRAESKISGSWRNWGLGEFQRRQERWRRLEEQSNSKKDMSDQVNLNYEQVYDHSGVLNANDSEGVRPPQSLEGVVRNFCAPECRKSGRVRRGLKSFVIDAKLDGNEHDSSLVYDKHQSWPLSAEIVSFRLAQGSSALSRLVSLARKTSLESQDHRNYSLDQNKDNPTPRHSASAWTRLKDGYFSTSKRQEGSHEVVGIISSPSQNLVAVMFSAFRSSPLQEEFTEPRASETVGRNNSNASCEGVSDGKRWKRSWRESFDLCVITATVNSLGLKWASGIDFEHARREGKVSIQQWGDFKLSTDKFLGLTESGCVYIWTAITGNFLARIDAFQFCQVPLHNSRDTDERTESKADSTAARARRFEPKGRQKFVQLVVTPDCSLVSVTNELGVVFLVSVDDYFLAHPQPFNTDPICSETDCYRKHKTLSSWEIAGSSIGNAAPVEGHSKDQLKMRVSSFGPNQGVTHKNLAAVGLFREDSTVILPTAGLNGFSSRVTQNDHEQRCTGTVDSSFKPLRQVFLPLNQNYSFVEMALNSYSITRLAINFKDRSKFTVVQNQLRISGGPFDEAMLSRQELSAVEGRLIKQHRYEGEVLSFTSQGCLYLVTATALHVVLPPLAFPSCQSGLVFPRDIPSWPSDLEIGMLSNKGIGLLPLLSRSHVQQWQSEVQDRSLIFDGLEEIERLCGENGWNLQLLRLRRLQLALDYVQIDKIEQALEGLVDVGAAEAGMPRVLFAAVELILAPYGTDNELVLASRLLSIAAQFSTRLVRRHAVAGARLRNRSSPRISTFPLSFESLQGQSASTFPNGVAELSRFIVVIRTLQEHLQAKRKGRSRSFKMSRETSFASRSASFKNRPIVEFPNESGSSDSNDYGNQIEHAKSLPSTADGPYLLMSQGVLTTTSSSLGAKSRWNQGAPEEVKGRRPSVESADEMFARWENTSVDAESVVRDALIAGRIPLAVVQLHRMLSRASLNSSPGCQPQIVDVFKDVQEISRGIVYELLCKGKMALAMAALRRLGEDIETALYQLAFGTVRRSLRKQTKKELLRHVRLGTLDSRLLGITTYLEGLYPHSSFWTSYAARQGQVATKEPIIEPVPSDDEKQSLRLICKSNLGGVFSLECGDRDVVVLGSWNTTKNSEAMEDSGSGQHITPPGYFVVAAVWLHAWNQPTVNRVILDRLHVANDHIPWVSLLEYHVAHHNWPSVSTLLDNIPETFLNSGVLHVLSDDNISSLRTQSKYPLGRASHQDITVPKVNYLRIDSLPLTSEWMVRLMEVKLARDLIFLRLYWERTALLSLLAAAGVLFMPSFDRSRTTKCKELVLATSMASKSFTPFKFHREAVQGVHELVIRHCVRLLLPHLLERYLAHHLLGLSKTSLTLLESYVGNCEWTRWELLSRLRGHEFDASLANFRSISTPNSSPGCKYVSMDDIAAAGQGLVVLATLMFAPVPLQKCLFFDHKMNGQEGQTWQCTLGNLREILQEYPTFCQTLEAASRGQDAWGFYSVRSSNSEETIPDISSYLLWRETIHSSVAGDAHLLHILPRWVPKSIQRLLQIVLKVPGGGSQGSLNQGGNFPVGNLRSSDQELGADLDEGVLQWEARVQTVIKQELYAPTTEEIEPGVEHYLRRGRALAAFNTLLGSRVLFLEPDTEGTGKSSQPPEYSKLLDSLSERDETLIASVYEFAISNFENSITVAACSLFLELCGVSAQMLRVDIAVLQRIAKYIRVKEQRDWASSSGANPPQVKLPSTVSLVRELAEEYATYSIKHPVGDLSQSKSKTNAGLVSTLQMLEKATLSDYSPKTIGGTPGSWLSNAAGNGDELRELQRSLSERWSLVTAFCRGHGLPLSTTYLVALARDNDWVGFLAEAQAIGCPLEVLINLASNEFTDPRLRCHILILLESLRTPSQTQTRPDFQEASRRGLNSTIPEDLFGLLAECEGKECPGADLLAKSEELQWPLLAVVASCFDDVKPISCLSIWLKITVSREVFGKSLKSKADEQLTATVGAAVEATNLEANTSLDVQFDRSNPKRQRYSLGSTAVLEKNDQIIQDIWKDGKPSSIVSNFDKMGIEAASDMAATEDSLAGLVALLCEHQLFLPLLQSFELFTPSSSVIPFIRFLQAFAQMRLTDASSELSSFSSLLKQESNKNAKSKSSWISRTAVAAAAAMLEACPSVYERRCLLELLSAVDFCDSGIAALKFRRLLRKLLLVEPSLSAGKETVVNGPYLGDDELLASLEASGLWDEGRMWAQQLDLKDHRVSSALHHVTETQAEAMVAEWKELLWDVQTERAALWDHCQALFVRHSFPPLQAGTFFLKHADTVENEVSKLEMQNILVLAFQWLSGSFTNSSPVYPIHLLHELEIRIWLLAVEAEVGMQNSTDEVSVDIPAGGHTSTITSMSPVDRTAETVSLVDLHLRNMTLKNRKEHSSNVRDTSSSNRRGHSSSPHKIRRKLKHSRHTAATADTHRTALQSKLPDSQDDKFSQLAFGETQILKGGTGSLSSAGSSNDLDSLNQSELIGSSVNKQDGSFQSGVQYGSWEERIGEGEVDRAVLALVEVGQVAAAKQLQQKLSPEYVPLELLLVEDAKKIASISEPDADESFIWGLLHPRVLAVLSNVNFASTISSSVPMQILNACAEVCREGCGRGLCRRIAAIAHISKYLDLHFTEAFEKHPVDLLQLLSFKGHEALKEATLLVSTHSMAAPAIARVLSETFYKGLAAAYRGGYSEMTETDEGPGPLLWRVSDFKQWAQLCPSESEIGHALMRLVISSRDLLHPCEVELLILAFQYYVSSECLDGLDVLVGFAATRVDSYNSEADFASLSRLVVGLHSLLALRFILDILVENGQLELLLQKTTWLDVVDADRAARCAVQGFHMGILSALNHFSTFDQDAFATVYAQFNMTYENAALLKKRAERGVEWWVKHPHPESSEELLETMRLFVEAADLYSAVDAGNSTSWCCAQASMISLQLRMPELIWLNLTETNARRLLIDQPRFAEALIVAEAYDLNQSTEWVPVLWNQMLQSSRIDQFLNDFVAILPLPATMLLELARFYRAEISARGYQLDFTKWLTPGAVPMELSRHLGKSMRALLKQVSNLSVRLQLATLATGFADVVDSCMQLLDRVPDTAGPLILRKGHGGAYIPLM